MRKVSDDDQRKAIQTTQSLSLWAYETEKQGTSVSPVSSVSLVTTSFSHLLDAHPASLAQGYCDISSRIPKPAVIHLPSLRSWAPV